MIFSEASKNKKSILLVDDEASILKLLEFVLQKDYHLVIKSNGFDALNWLDSGNIPDLIISDLEMPYFDGSDFLRAVKVSGYYREIPIIVLSGSSTLEEIESRIPYNINGLMSKPFNPTLLKEKIKALLN
ncbi:response regulator receiver protein [Pseudopedobacter saltans DSM 12145]|uniref:Response regulator receiver protein n=1 Tax=Pseudopedobacter saltans (strain ATCC 51119 / DSM 12145 / JCM 21818 / CCUG 39354 / LMG 10337 / NBRC 100064 / NCIMB 13643) TaxID=762903 RepID=F0SBJ4_PSESL|nr:response regulator [Pseudopedobacter saltans]ADY51640.1 response regulator receiver protein [Pseudopedobacter saltans DSM 12145]